MIIFPIRIFDRIDVFLATCLWNFCEIVNIRTPFAHIVFGIIMGVKSKEIKDANR